MRTIGARAKTIFHRAVRAGRAVAWLLRSRGRVWSSDREWVLQELGLLRDADVDGVRLLRISPAMSGHRPLVDPPAVPGNAAAFVAADDVVLGLAVGADARAYPWWVMGRPHVANDVIGGRPVVVVVCRRCGTAVAFDPVVGGTRLTFRKRYYFNGAVALEDLETRSVWSPYLGEAIKGTLAGTRLELIPLVQMEWQRWVELHPNTTVVAADPAERTQRGYRPGQRMSDDLFAQVREGLGHTDDRIPRNTLVLGVVTERGQRAYPLSAVGDHGGVVNDSIGGVPVVVFGEAAGRGYAALAFSRLLDGLELSFVAGPEGPLDRDTGSLWGLDGRAVAGPLAGRRLAFVDSHVSKWFGWVANFPSIDLFDHDAAAPGGVVGAASEAHRPST